MELARSSAGEGYRELPWQGHQWRERRPSLSGGAGKAHQPRDLNILLLVPWCLGALVPNCQGLFSIPALHPSTGGLLSVPCQNETRGWAGLVGRSPLPLLMSAMDTR